MSSQHPPDRGLVELGPVVQSGPTYEAAVRSVEHGEHPVAALAPLVSENPQPLLSLGAVEPPHEPRNVGVVMQTGEFGQIRGLERTQEESFGLDDHDRGLTRATAPPQSEEPTASPQGEGRPVTRTLNRAGQPALQGGSESSYTPRPGVRLRDHGGASRSAEGTFDLPEGAIDSALHRLERQGLIE